MLLKKSIVPGKFKIIFFLFFIIQFIHLDVNSKELNKNEIFAELNILDGVTSTATELNIMDGNTSASSTTVVDADRVVFNDNGTMKQVAMTDISAYTDAGATALAIALG